jgi:HSP20 family protein
MPIIRWRPFEKDLDKFFEQFHAWEQADLSIDVYEKNDNIIVEMALAGVNPDNVDISVEDTSIRISGTREEKEEVKDKNYYCKEIKRGSFDRLISLPATVVPEQARAEFKDGMLTIYLPKKKAAQANKIKVARK